MKALVEAASMQTALITPAPNPSGISLRERLGNAVRRASALAATCASCCRQGYATHALYKELAGLSQAELRQRGLAHGDLYRHIGDHLGQGTCDGRSRSVHRYLATD
jgi:hypothetical protein